jgi:hypothetical protein
MNHVVFRGDTANFRLEVKDRLRGAVNVTGWTFILSAARKRGGTVAFSANGAITNAESGIVEFELMPEQTADVGHFFYDVQASTPASKVYTVDTGEIEIVQDVTP